MDQRFPRETGSPMVLVLSTHPCLPAISPTNSMHKYIPRSGDEAGHIFIIQLSSYIPTQWHYLNVGFNYLLRLG